MTYHGGPVLSHASVEAVFIGPQWASDPGLQAQAGQLEGYLQFLTGSSFMDMLTRAGYRVGRGTYLDSQVVPVDLQVGMISDATIQQTLADSIAGGSLPAPDADRLYFVFVEPGVDVVTPWGESAVNLLGYHGAFWGPTGAAVTYAVVPDLAVPNAFFPGLSSFELMTKTASHELAEAVTDPQGTMIGTNAWYDSTWRDPTSGARGGEIADIAERAVVDLGGYVVQGVAGRNDQVLIPAGGTFDPRFPAPRHGRPERVARRAGRWHPGGHHARHHTSRPLAEGAPLSPL
jgi:hypothetical protein